MPKEAPDYLKKKSATPSGFDQNELKPLCQEYKDLRQDKERLEAELSAVGTRMAEISDQLVEKFQRMGLNSAKMEGLGVFFVANTPRPKIVDETQLFADLRRRKMGAIIKETVHNATLASAVKEARDNGDPDFAGVEIFEQTQIRLRKQ